MNTVLGREQGSPELGEIFVLFLEGSSLDLCVFRVNNPLDQRLRDEYPSDSAVFNRL